MPPRLCSHLFRPAPPACHANNCWCRCHTNRACLLLPPSVSSCDPTPVSTILAASNHGHGREADKQTLVGPGQASANTEPILVIDLKLKDIFTLAICWPSSVGPLAMHKKARTLGQSAVPSLQRAVAASVCPALFNSVAGTRNRPASARTNPGHLAQRPAAGCSPA